jgi:uncharacterized phage protein (TIGR01671 family)
MREIKFRAWDKGRREYLSAGQILIAVLSGNHPKSSPQYLDILKGADVYKERFVLEQFTGLKDKNGKEIYEGDIIRNQYGLNGVIKWRNDRFIVEWMNDGTGLRFDFDHWAINNFIDIIGNIYENPELLTQPSNDNA